MCVALVALVLAASGGAYAAATGSAGTIAACMRHKGGGLYVAHKCARHDTRLRWSVTGPKGATGTQGPVGPNGPAGATGPQGLFPGLLPSGATLRGAYAVFGTASSSGALAGDQISFGFELSAAPTAHFINSGATPPAACPGTAAQPEAAPGNLCIYEGTVANVGARTFQDPVTLLTGSTVRAWGAEVGAVSAAAGNFYTAGSWAVTAP